MSAIVVAYDAERALATVRGPGGFTQFFVPRHTALAIAEALGVPLEEGL